MCAIQLMPSQQEKYYNRIDTTDNTTKEVGGAGIKKDLKVSGANRGGGQIRCRCLQAFGVVVSV